MDKKIVVPLDSDAVTVRGWRLVDKAAGGALGSQPMEKPTVIYTDVAPDWPPRVGRSARVQVLNHPRHSRGAWVYTTRVVRIEGAKFETGNTHYVPGETDPMSATKRTAKEKI